MDTDRGVRQEPLTDVSKRAAQILEQAQALADKFRLEVEAAADLKHAEAAAQRDETQRTLADAQAEEARAVEIRDRALAHLAAARVDADQLIRDAAGQAAIMTSRAEAVSAEAVEKGRDEAENLVMTSRAEAHALRGVSTQEREKTRRQLADLVSESLAEIDVRRKALDDEEAARRAVLDEEVSRRTAEVLHEAARMRAELDAEIVAGRLVLTRERQTFHAQQQRDSDDALTVRERLLEEARIHADSLVSEAADQLGWSREAVESLLAQAEIQRKRLKNETHQRLAAHTRAVHAQLRVVLARVRHAESARMAEAQDHDARLQAQAEAFLVAAQSDAHFTRARARTEADQLVTDAQARAADESERVEWRLAEAEASGLLLQEQAQTVFAEAQQVSLERAKAARSEAMAMLSSAREDADAIRAEAGAMLDEARAEVARLAQRRVDITTQLGHMRGVIDALALSGHDHPHPNQE